MSLCASRGEVVRIPLTLLLRLGDGNCMEISGIIVAGKGEGRRQVCA